MTRYELASKLARGGDVETHVQKFKETLALELPVPLSKIGSQEEEVPPTISLHSSQSG